MSWKEEGNFLVQDFRFSDFSEAFSFMKQVADLAEEMDHHPLWTNSYNKVNIKLNTHDAGDVITEKDREMARRIDEILLDS